MKSHALNPVDARAVLPTLRARETILRQYLPSAALAPGTDLSFLARMTSGLAEQALVTLCKRMTPWAATGDLLTEAHFLEGLEQMLLEGTTLVFLDDVERRRVAYHRIGHLVLDRLKPVQVVQLPVTLFAPALSLQRMRVLRDATPLTESIAYLDVLLAGAAAEQLEFERLSPLAEADLAEATSLAHRLAHPSNGAAPLDDARLLDQRRQVVSSILLDNRNLLETLVEVLMQEEIIREADLPF